MIPALQDALLKWYPLYGRIDMPIRHLSGENAPYEIYISEIMSAQTQINVVLDKFYYPFLQAFPTLKHLAQAPLEQVLILWKGLGYYARAKNLHKAAQICMVEHGGLLPQDYKALCALPGIGAYSAGAILCFGFRQAVGVVDANVSRVLLRLFGMDISSQSLKADLQNQANAFVNLTNPFDHNQALIDLGALICTPKNPQCHLCPLHFACQGQNNIERFSVPKKTPSIALTQHYGVCVDQGGLYLSLPPKGLYAGLYQFPLLKEQDLVTLPFIGSIKHSYTKYRLQIKLYQARLHDLVPTNLKKIPLSQFDQIPISSMTAKIWQLCQKKSDIILKT
ncbi:A/G-specific adenine glycosylase [Helicobacter bizzozeronii]|uniref:A/G-specific adenine glycosylase n=1 Tax=Helicobacter bizzozeronii TaxID=56877 RepID=UPI000CEDA166|nr:A/G-specific adenine glycosylase [Helicobacter bizzozeronii]